MTTDTTTGERKVRISFDVFGQDGNAYGLLAQFRKHARRQGWSRDEISRVTYEAKCGDYNHLLVTLSSHIDFVDDEEGER